MVFSIIVFFILGYLGIIFEKTIKIDKAAFAILTGMGSWIIFLAFAPEPLSHKLPLIYSHLSDISQIVFFLMGAMLIVEAIDAHQGFRHIGAIFQFQSSQMVFWAILFLSFFLSAVLDNLTTTIVMIYLLRKVVHLSEQRILFSAAVITAVNAGGAWTPIGDVTTTMLWISEKISTFSIMGSLFLPCFLSLIFFGWAVSFYLPRNIQLQPVQKSGKYIIGSCLIPILGFLALVLIPVYKALIGLPPFMGMMLGVTVLWITIDLIHRNDPERYHLKIFNLLCKIDLSSILFFFGILFAVDALETVGVLKYAAHFLERTFQDSLLIAIALGMISSVIDNVPLVAASIRMFTADIYPPNDPFWNLIAYSAGTGGSILIIGSAPGIAVMTMEKTEFFWYLKRISLISLATYFVGIGIYYVFN